MCRVFYSAFQKVLKHLCKFRGCPAATALEKKSDGLLGAPTTVTSACLTKLVKWARAVALSTQGEANVRKQSHVAQRKLVVVSDMETHHYQPRGLLLHRAMLFGSTVGQRCTNGLQTEEEKVERETWNESWTRAGFGQLVIDSPSTGCVLAMRFGLQPKVKFVGAFNATGLARKDTSPFHRHFAENGCYIIQGEHDRRIPVSATDIRTDPATLPTAPKRRVFTPRAVGVPVSALFITILKTSLERASLPK